MSFIGKLPSVTQRSVSQKNAFQKRKHLSRFFTQLKAEMILLIIFRKIQANSHQVVTPSESFTTFSFFIFSGFLVTYLTLKELAKTNGRVNWFLFYFHRFWRITPLYMVCLAIWATLIGHMGKGPNKEAFTESKMDMCHDYWWANLLYIQNLYPYPGNLSRTVSLY